MSSTTSFNDYLQFGMYIAIFGASICLLIFLMPQPKWARPDRLVEEDGKLSDAPLSEGKLLPAISQALAILVGAFILMGILVILFGFPIFFSAIVGIAVVGMIVPTVHELQAKRRTKDARLEALAIAEYIAGRMSAQAPLFEALEDLNSECLDGKRELSIAGEDLDEAVRRVRLGNPLDNELQRLSIKFHDLAALRQVFTTYALMVRAGMGQEAEIFQANDLSESQSISDELANVLETEMSTATMSRVAMFLLIGGMILFLIFYGAGLGDVLVNTLPGNFVIGGALLSLYLGQLVGSRLERLPTLEF